MASGDSYSSVSQEWAFWVLTISLLDYWSFSLQQDSKPPLSFLAFLPLQYPLHFKMHAILSYMLFIPFTLRELPYPPTLPLVIEIVIIILLKV